MKRTPSQVAKIFSVDRDIVKSWAFHFKEYLSDSGNPPKGEIRKFEDGDIPILAYVYEHWEDKPNIESIKIGLNRNEYQESRYFEPLYFNSKIFQDLPDYLDGIWTHGILFCGAKVGDSLAVAKAYKLAAITMIDAALKSNEAHEYDYPIFYLCRHVLELYLKILGDLTHWTHDLGSCMRGVENKFNKKIKGMVRIWIEEFAAIDKKGTAFRYDNDETSYVELWVDLHQLKAVMNELCRLFEAEIWDHNLKTKSKNSTI